MRTRIVLFVLAVSLIAAFGLATQAKAGCIGGSLGEGCIGIPTPRSDQERPYRYEDHDREHVVIEHRHRRHRAPVVIERDDDRD